MRKNKKETGIKLLEDKSYFVRVTRRIQGKRVELRGTATTKAEAKNLLAQYTLDLDNRKIKEESNSITFEKANDLWLASLDPDLAIGTIHTYMSNYKTIIRAINKDALIEEIDLKDIENLRKVISHKSNSHINTCIKQVNRVLDYCRKLGYTEKNGVQDFELIKESKNSKIKKKLKEADKEQLGVVYNSNEIAAMLDVLKGGMYEPVFRIGYAMGMRIAEVLGLTWDNVDLEKGTINVVQQLQYYQGKGYVMVYPKSLQSCRFDLFMPLDLLKYMKGLYNQQKEKGLLEVQNDIKNEDGKKLNVTGFVCCDDKGYHLKQSAPTVMQNTLEKAGFRGFYSHSLRKTHTTELARSGMPLHAVSERLGHEDITTTLKFYTHNTEEDKKILNDFIRGIE